MAESLDAVCLRMPHGARRLVLSKCCLPPLLLIVLLAQGCATSGTQPADKPYRERAQTHVRGDLTVTVSVPTAAEAEEIYGVDLAEEEIQPVWIEVRNDSAAPYWFLASGLDSNYYSVSEVAYAFSSANADGTLEQRIAKLQFRNPIMPGSTVSGFVLANRDEGVKAVAIDLVGRRDVKSVTSFIVDPTFKAVSRRLDFAGLYSDDELVQVDEGQRCKVCMLRQILSISVASGSCAQSWKIFPAAPVTSSAPVKGRRSIWY